MILYACISGSLMGLIVFLVFRLQVVNDRHRQDYRDWDVERGRYVAALLSQSKAGDLAASAVVRPKPAKADLPAKPVIYQEGM